MTETDAEPPASTDPSAPPKRPWTILGRLSQAIREQNWFAVVLEVLIVIVGVVIGFQVTAWGQERAERVREQGYLRQLVEDLRKTEDEMLRADVTRGITERSVSQLLESFDTPERPPPDSVYAWIGMSRNSSTTRPVLGTVRSLLTSGDLGLIRDDDLRVAITGYFEDGEAQVTRTHQQSVRISELGVEMRYLVDMRAVVTVYPFQQQIGYGHPAMVEAVFGSGRSPDSEGMERFYGAPEAYGLVVELALLHINAAALRAGIARDAQALREQVEAELNR